MSPELSIVVAAAVGALAAILGSVIPSIMKGRSDRELAEIERSEKRKEEKYGLEIKLTERDIYKIEEAADLVLIALRKIHHIGERQQALQKSVENRLISEDEKDVELRELDEKLANHNEEMRRALMISARRAHSISDEVKKKYLDYDNIIKRMHQLLGQNDEDQNKLWFKVFQTGGDLQKILRQTLLEINCIHLEHLSLRVECTERSNLLLAKDRIASAVKLLRNDILYELCSTSF